MGSYILFISLIGFYSLSALSDVLNALSEHRNHVPYRNSTLTQLLKDSIGKLIRCILKIREMH